MFWITDSQPLLIWIILNPTLGMQERGDKTQQLK